MATRSIRLTLAEWLFAVTEAKPELLEGDRPGEEYRIDVRPDPPGRDLPPYAPRQAPYALRRAPRYVPSGRPRVNFNGKVRDGKHPIFCRHFAYAYFRSADKTQFLDGMQQADDIWANFDQRTEAIEQETKDLARQTDETAKHFVGPEHLGDFLFDITTEMRQHGTGSADILLTTSLHQMSLNISVDAQNPDSEIRIKIYDPNVTTDDDEYIFASANDLQGTNFIELVKTGDQYFAEMERSMMAICRGVALPAPSALDYLDMGSDPDASQQLLLNHAMATGLPSVIRALGQSWAGREDDVVASGVLFALDDERNSGLGFAAQYGDARAMMAWAEILFDLDLSVGETLDLVRYKDAKGLSAFFIAMEHGDARSVAAMGEIWEMLGFSRDDIVAMMNEKDRSGRSAPMAAIDNGKDECGDEYDRLMTRFGIERRELSLL